MSNFILNNTAEEVNSAIGKVAGADNTPTDISPLMVTSGGVKAYVDSQVSAVDSRVTALESEVANIELETAVSLERSTQFSTSSQSYQTVPLSSHGQPPYFTNNGNNTFRILQGNYLMWFSFFWKTTYTSTNSEINLRLQALSGMSDFAISTFVDSNNSYSTTKTVLLDASFRSVNQDTTFSLQVRDEPEGNSIPVYVKDVAFTILKV